ncbi:hypothetical protein TNCV_1705821 [Trichonephila clavipes]|uniref:Uncharacterized protein n=1 Tax=Trichonephila clavipes TaxID=2585209 RepID=A0A8X6RF42_TRICX|nr:hypothetical protein TNCV_1705821 [Trichonephila clavipes]
MPDPSAEDLNTRISVTAERMYAMSGKFQIFPSLSLTIQKEDDALTHVHHLNAFHCDFENRFENALSLVIP